MVRLGKVRRYDQVVRLGKLGRYGRVRLSKVGKRGTTRQVE